MKTARLSSVFLFVAAVASALFPVTAPAQPGGMTMSPPEVWIADIETELVDGKTFIGVDVNWANVPATGTTVTVYLYSADGSKSASVSYTPTADGWIEAVFSSEKYPWIAPGTEYSVWAVMTVNGTVVDQVWETYTTDSVCGFESQCPCPTGGGAVMMSVPSVTIDDIWDVTACGVTAIYVTVSWENPPVPPMNVRWPVAVWLYTADGTIAGSWSFYPSPAGSNGSNTAYFSFYYDANQNKVPIAPDTQYYVWAAIQANGKNVALTWDEYTTGSGDCR